MQKYSKHLCHKRRHCLAGSTWNDGSEQKSDERSNEKIAWVCSNNYFNSLTYLFLKCKYRNLR